MRLGLRLALVAFAVTSSTLASTIVRAGDDGAAPLWEGIGSIFGWSWGGGGDKKDPIDYREHGKIVVPPKMDLPPPGASSSVDPTWPVNQEVQRKKAQKEAKGPIAGVGDARLRYTQPFPNAPVEVRTADQDLAKANGAGGNAVSSSPLGNLNPLNWVGMGKTVPLGPEPDREWLTDPPQGFRAPVGPVGSAAN
jgi:hypothetical protein